MKHVITAALLALAPAAQAVTFVDWEIERFDFTQSTGPEFLIARLDIEIPSEPNVITSGKIQPYSSALMSGNFWMIFTLTVFLLKTQLLAGELICLCASRYQQLPAGKATGSLSTKRCLRAFTMPMTRTVFCPCIFRGRVRQATPRTAFQATTSPPPGLQ